MLETIKSYLVSLGFDVDKSSYDSAKKAMGSLEKGVMSFASSVVKTFAKATTAMIAFGVAATSATAKWLGGLGNQEIQMEMLSRQLWTTEQQAQAFSLTLKAMGASLQNLYLSPTLMAQYQKLQGTAMQMQTPGDYNNQIKQIQDVQLQLKQMRLEAYYSLQWIGYYFIKYMSGPISRVHDVLASINEVIVKNMPTWTKKVAEVMASFMQAGIYIVQAMGNVYRWLQKILSYVPGWAKGIAAALAILSISNPFMLMVEGISAALLLMDDFQTYVHGGKALFPKLWAQVEKVNSALTRMQIGKQIGEDLKSTFDALSKTLQNTAQFASNLFNIFKENGTLTNSTNSFKRLGNALLDLAKAIGNIITGIGHLFGLIHSSQNQGDVTNFFQLIVNVASFAIKVVAGAIEEIASLANIVGDVLHGKWGDAWNVFNNMLSHQNLANAGIISQRSVIGAGGPPIGPPSYPYMYHTSASSSPKTVNVNAPVNNYISGTSPEATASAINNNYNRHLYNLRGLIQ